MNKDVIYIEPEDDITDIITKIENSKEKIVALMPPKKAGVFRSVVNIKLIAKAGATSEKTIVIVTTDPSIVKLAAAAKIPVTKDLQTAPTIPTVEVAAEETTVAAVNEDGKTIERVELDEAEVTEEPIDGSDEPEGKKETKRGKGKEEPEDDPDDLGDKPRKKPKLSLKNSDAKKTSGGLLGWAREHKKAAIGGGIGVVILILVLVWALVIAPAATVTVGIRTTSNNFSENVSFTSTLSDEDAEEGKFYLEEKKVESIQEVSFEATGTKNIGEKASGEVTVIATVSSDGGTIQVKSGDTFTNGGLKFIADNSVTMTYDGKDDSVCDNADSVTKREFDIQGCKIYARVKVTAAESGSRYNISARESGWDTTAPVSVYSTNAMSGGTDETVTVVQQSDIDKARAELSSTDETANKEKLYAEIGDGKMVIESSFKQVAGEAISTPAVGEEVKEGVTPTLKATTTASVFVIDKVKVEEFITKKADLSDSQKIYEMKDPFIENFSETSQGYTGKLKTSYMTGPKITENDVIDKIKGKGLGEAQHDLRDIDGVASVDIDKSFPWVMSIPGNPNKITVIFEVKDQDGNKLELKDQATETTDDSNSDDTTTSEDKKE